MNIDNDFFTRYGGEEFAIILPNTKLDVAKEIAERIRSAIADQKLNNNTIPMTSSFGVAVTVPSPAKGYKALIKAADLALYNAKDAGRNNVCCGGSH